MLRDLISIMGSGSVLGYFLQVVPITGVVGIIYILIRISSIRKNAEVINLQTEFIRFLFVCYMTGLVSLVILPVNFWLYFFEGVFFREWDELLPIFSFGNINLVPSVFRVLYGELILGRWVKTMIVGNILMFLPLGFFCYVTSKVDYRRILRVSIVIPLIIEMLQLCFGRSFDVDDLICNFIGIISGYIIAVLFTGKADE